MPGLHRDESQDLEQVGDHHVFERPDRLVELGAVLDGESLRDVDLDVVDELAVPDRLEQAVGEPEGKDVLGGFFAEEVIDPEDLLFVEPLVDGLVEIARALQVDTERLFHDDAGVRRKVRLVQGVHHRQHRLGRDAEVMQQPDVVAAECLGLLGNRAGQRLRSGLLRNKRQVGDELVEEFVADLVVSELLARLLGQLAKSVVVDLVERRSDHPHLGRQLRARQVEQTG
jgi:hypothetical protein